MGERAKRIDAESGRPVHDDTTIEPTNVSRRRTMPKARTAKNCYYCEADDRIKMTFMLCGLCHRHFCSAHGVPDLEQCTKCLEASEETE